MSSPPPSDKHIHWQPLANLLDTPVNPGDESSLPGFDTEFSGIVDFIIKITHRIWEQKNVGRCYDYYADPCPVHTLGGYSESVSEVVQNTLAMVAAFPDRSLIGENVVWSNDGDDRYYSSHRITSTMTHTGACEFGPATGRSAWVMTIADCICYNNQVVYEWLMRDNSFLALQLGLEPLDVAAQWAKNTPHDAFEPWWNSEHQRVSQVNVRATADWPEDPEATAIAQAWVQTLLNRKEFGAIESFYHPSARVLWPGGRHPIGLRGIAGTFIQWLSQFADTSASCDHVAATVFGPDTLDIAIRWTLAGRYSGLDPALQHCRNLPVLVLASSHLRLHHGQITEESTVFDEIALYANLLRRQSES